MERDEYQDDPHPVYIAADIVVALAMCAVAALGVGAAFGLVEIARWVWSA